MKQNTNSLRVLLVLVAGAVSLGFLPFGDKMPAQPIDFPHRRHAGEYKIPCQYCHTSARRSPQSGIPSVERCMGCHKIVAVNKPEIQKLKGYYNRKEPIPWVRIFHLPDFVFFRHHPHISAAVECQTCHGEVQTFDRFRERPFLEMGWCMECHRKQQRAAEIADCYTCHR